VLTPTSGSREILNLDLRVLWHREDEASVVSGMSGDACEITEAKRMIINL